MKVKICGVSDPHTLTYITNHDASPEYIGFIVNYKKSKRFVEFNKLKKLLNIDKKKSDYVAVLVKPTEQDLIKISKLPFDYYQIYDLDHEQIKLIKKKFKVKIIVAITVKNKNDTSKYKNYKDIADIILFDSKGYEKSLSFDHSLLKNLKLKSKIMVAGNIKYNDQLDKFIKIADIIDISGGLETSGEKDISKIDIFLKNLNKLNNEN